MNDSEKKRYGVIALALTLGGLVLAVVIGMIASRLGHKGDVIGYCVFLGFQVAGFVLGVISRQTALGKTAYITAAILSVGSAALL